MKRYIIFDFDGTIVQSEQIFIQIFNQLAGKYGGRRLEESDIPLMKDLSIPDRMRALNIPMYKLPALMVEGSREYKQSASKLSLFEGLREVLIELKERGFALGILSSNSVENIEKFLQEQQLTVFEFVYSATNLFGKDKAIHKLAKKHRIDRSQILYVGDELRDIQACKRIGVKVAAVTWGYDSVKLLTEAEPDYLCEVPVDILGLLADT